MSQESDPRVPTPIAHQIENCRQLLPLHKPTDVRTLVLRSAIATLEQLIPTERRTLMLTHAAARGMREPDPIAILWFTNTFLPYVTSPT